MTNPKIRLLSLTPRKTGCTDYINHNGKELERTRLGRNLDRIFDEQISISLPIVTIFLP